LSRTQTPCPLLWAIIKLCGRWTKWKW